MTVVWLLTLPALCTIVTWPVVALAVQRESATTRSASALAVGTQATVGVAAFALAGMTPAMSPEPRAVWILVLVCAAVGGVVWAASRKLTVRGFALAIPYAVGALPALHDIATAIGN